MPAVNVARTDTFEQQRVKINTIATQIFSISAGGSDLSTGVLKLGDGSLTAPSLSFSNEEGLGFFRPNNKTLGITSTGKKLVNFTNSGFYSFKDSICQKNIITDLVTSNPGSLYDAGSFNDVQLLGGTGEDATANINVTAYIFNQVSDGVGYSVGQYNEAGLEGGNGNDDATINFEVKGLEATVTNGGNGYLPGSYTSVPVQNVSSSGSGETASVVVGGTINYGGSITAAGSSYDLLAGESESTYNNLVVIAASPAQTYTVTSVSNPGTPPPNSIYQLNGTDNPALTLDRGNTYRFDISDSSLSGHPFIFQTTGGAALDEQYFQLVEPSGGNFVDLVIKEDAPLGDIEYACQLHAGMGNTITVVNGTAGFYGHGMTANVTVGGSNTVTGFEIVNIGEDYAASDVVSVDISGGSGFEYTLGTPVYAGIVASIDFNNDGTGYNKNDTVTVNDADIGGKGGSNFVATITTQPGAVDNFQFVSKGTGYQTGDNLKLPDTTTGVNCTVNGTVALECTWTTGSNNVTVSSTANLAVGMTMSGTVEFSGVITIVNILSGTLITVSDSPTIDGSGILDFSTIDPATQLEVASTTGIYKGMVITFTSGTAALPTAETTVDDVDRVNNTVTMSQDSQTPGTAVATFTPEYGANPTTDWEIEVGTLGVIDAATINNPGNGYEFQDNLSINPISLVAPQTFAVTNIDTQKIDFTITIADAGMVVGDTLSNGTETAVIIFKNSIGGNVDYVLVEDGDFQTTDTITNTRTSVGYTANTILPGYRYKIDNQLEPTITMYSGDTYDWDVSNDSNDGHTFAFSAFPDGIFGPSKIEDVAVTTVASSTAISVPSSAGILAGMEVVLITGQGIVSGTKVASVDSATAITMDTPALITGSCVCTFRGVEYTNGVERIGNIVRFRPSADTPNPLYYYCKQESSGHADEGGTDGNEVAMTVDQSNPRVFGSDAAFIVGQVTSVDTIVNDVETGTITLSDVQSTEATIGTVNYTTGSGSTFTATNRFKTPQIEGTNDVGGLTLSSSNTIFTGSINVNDLIQMSHVTGVIQTSGEIKSTTRFNVSDKLRLAENVVSTTSTDDLVLTAFTGRLVKVTNNTALVIPCGGDTERPINDDAQDGAIRFNTDTKQYEGYSEDTQTWSSLGGIRDLDGNTTILAEESIGANDNTLWFMNDNINSVKFTKDWLSFENAKTIRSSNTAAPNYQNWVANVAVTVGLYLKYGNNLFEVMVAGTTATSGSPPTDLTGSQFVNGTTQLRWTHLAVAPLIFSEIEELRIGPTGDLPVSINGDLRLADNTISTDINDIIIRPNSGKKVVIDAPSSIAIPVGTDNQRGVSVQGSVRFNTDSSQFEGYDGTNWGSLGGVKDVDQNTYIIPETSPGANENILYFFNDNNNTLRLTTNELIFDTIDTVKSVTSDEFELTASLLTIDAAATTLDNTSATNTFLHSAKQFFDIGISAGLTVDPVLRLDNQGDILFNTGFGSGVFSGITLYNKELTTTELADIKIITKDLNVVKGTTNVTGTVIYTTSTELSAKVCVTAHNPTTGDKEFIEFGVLDDGTDVIFTEYGNIRTDISLVTPSFVYTENDEVRLNINVGSGVADTQTVNITVVSHVTKK
jgi:hypothetical protein